MYSLARFVADEQRKLAVWHKGHVDSNYDPAVYRRDYVWRLIKYSDHGNRNSAYGWEFGHIVARALGGSDDVINLRPEHWETNASSGGLLGALLR